MSPGCPQILRRTLLLNIQINLMRADRHHCATGGRHVCFPLTLDIVFHVVIHVVPKLLVLDSGILHFVIVSPLLDLQIVPDCWTFTAALLFFIVGITRALILRNSATRTLVRATASYCYRTLMLA